MNIIITMAGESSRFTKAGFKQPKYELIVNGKPMFQWALLSLENFFQEGHFVFIGKKGVSPFIEKQLKKLAINQYQIIEIDYVTSGQAATALIAVKNLAVDSPVMIYNIDTYIQYGVPKSIPENCDGWIPIFSAQGQQWSFVLMDENKDVLKVIEKERISEWATIGLYYFSSALLFLESYNATFSENNFYGETYIAPMYEHLIKKKARVVAEIMETKNVIPLGTPNEVLEFDSKFTGVNK